MTDHTLPELAERAGVEPQYVEDLVTAGVLAAIDGRYRATDVRRIRIVQMLDRAGLPIDAIGAAVRSRDLSLDFVEQPSYDVYASHTTTTFDELSRTSAVPVDVLLAVREAMGFARAAPEDRVRETELALVPFAQHVLGMGVRPSVLERSIRVYGDNIRRVAEAESDWWRSELLEPLLRAGGRVGDIGAETERYSTRELMELTDAAILALFHGQQSNAWMRNMIEGFEFVLARSGLHQSTARPPAICFLDLTGYTRLTEERGDDAAADLAGRLATLVQRLAVEHAGKPVKWLGDGVMFHFRDPGDAVAAALEMVAAVATEGMPPARVGIHAGSVLYQEGDYFGRTVNAASRIADYARPGEVVVSQEAVDAAGGLNSVAFTEIGPVELKGLAGSLKLHVARSSGAEAVVSD